MFQAFIVKLDYTFHPARGYGVIALITILTLMCCVPIHVFYMRTRIELFKTLMHIVVSPFGPVKFKDFFLADILTSLTNTIKDMVATIFLFTSG